jgi:hypothetical protein
MSYCRQLLLSALLEQLGKGHAVGLRVERQRRLRHRRDQVLALDDIERPVIVRAWFLAKAFPSDIADVAGDVQRTPLTVV